MTYAAPLVNTTGLIIPSYQDILDDLIAQAKTIYGQDIYLDEDSADYQFLSVIALKIFDCMNSLQLAYNNRNPQTAIGAALESLVKLNGLAKKSASYSTCTVTISGTAGTVILNGVVGDANSVKWSLPPSVTIGVSGTIDVVATCQTIGAISALAGEVNKILTPQAGWTSVTNAAAATLGQAVETDAQLRARQAVSTQIASKTMLGGTIGAIADVAGVTRYRIYENPTGSLDSNNLPAHSITCVVEGGTDANVANAIYTNRGIGCYTNGDQVVSVADPDSGITSSIRFYRTTYDPIYATIGIKALSGYTSAYTTAILAAIVDFLNSFEIGKGFSPSVLYAPILSVMPDLKSPIFEVTSVVAGTSSGSQGTADITVLFNHVIHGLGANITINVT